MLDDSLGLKTCSYIKWYSLWNRVVFDWCILLLFCRESYVGLQSHISDVQARLPGWQNFIWWCLSHVSSVWKCFMSTFWHLEFEVAARFLQHLSIWHMTQLLQVHTKNKSCKHMLTVERNSGNPLTRNKPHIYHKISFSYSFNPYTVEHNQLLAMIIYNKMWYLGQNALCCSLWSSGIKHNHFQMVKVKLKELNIEPSSHP